MLMLSPTVAAGLEKELSLEDFEIERNLGKGILIFLKSRRGLWTCNKSEA